MSRLLLTTVVVIVLMTATFIFLQFNDDSELNDTDYAQHNGESAQRNESNISSGEDDFVEVNSSSEVGQIEHSTTETNARSDASGDAEDNNQEVSIGSLLTVDGEDEVLDSSSLQALSASELRDSINRIDSEGNKNNLSFETEYKLERKLGQIDGVASDALQCSDAICGLLFSSHDEEIVASALDRLSRDEELGSISNGGVLRAMEEHGTHHGLLILVLDRGQSLQVR